MRSVAVKFLWQHNTLGFGGLASHKSLFPLLFPALPYTPLSVSLCLPETNPHTREPDKRTFIYPFWSLSESKHISKMFGSWNKSTPTCGDKRKRSDSISSINTEVGTLEGLKLTRKTLMAPKNSSGLRPQLAVSLVPHAALDGTNTVHRSSTTKLRRAPSPPIFCLCPPACLSRSAATPS